MLNPTPKRVYISFAFIVFTALVLVHCSPSTTENPQPKAIDGTQVRMDFTRKKGFYTAPFPSEDLRKDDGSIALDAFPNQEPNDFIGKLLTLLKKEARGFAVSGAVYFQVSEAIKKADLPSMEKSITKESPIFLMSVDEKASDFGKRYPITSDYQEDGGPFGTERQLSVLPLQGVPLQENTLYAVVISRKLKDAKGKGLGVSLSMVELSANKKPQGMSEKAFTSYKKALDALEKHGVSKKDIAGLSVFRTDTPTLPFKRLYEAHKSKPNIQVEGTIQKTKEFDDFCFYSSKVKMPNYQSGKPPFLNSGGGWIFEKDKAKLQGQELSRVFITVPKTAMPPAGFPIVVFVRTGGGGDNPLVHRGVRGKDGNPLKPGTGPAMNFAKAGIAAISVDGPHGGPRNVESKDEQFLMFNITNPPATRDNVRQSAFELTLLPRMIEKLSFAVSGCPGVKLGNEKVIKFDTNKIGIMGHSMGATIAPLTVAFEHKYSALVLSGGGGSYIENIMYKEKPIKVRPIAEGILGYTASNRSLTRHDPALTLLQWAAEPADPPLYTARILRSIEKRPPVHVLMLQGIVDHYIMPPIANALSLSLGLDLAGPILDASTAELKPFTPLEKLLKFVGRKTQKLPVSGNLSHNGRLLTGLVIQHKQGPIEDGHEVVFQTEAPKHQYRCFFESAFKGVPSVPEGGKEWDSCK